MKRGAHAMVDYVTGEDIFYFTDLLGREWLATSAWSMFRATVPVPKHIRDALLLEESNG
jgi:hypothetical protein